VIWLRGFWAVFLAVIFFVLLVVTLVLFRVLQTALEPDFYKDQLSKEDFYNFVLNDLLTSAINDARNLPPDKFPGSQESNALVASGLTTEQIVASVNRAVPPDWLQGEAEMVIDQLGGYLLARRDEFELRPQLGDQAAIMVDEVQALLKQANAYDLVFSELVDPYVEKAADTELPLGIKVTPERLSGSVRTIFPPEWLNAQIDGIIDEASPYFTGQKDSFAIHVAVADRIPIALDEIKAILRESDAYDLLYTQVVEPRVTETLQSQVSLPAGITLTREEVLDALRRVAPRDWVQQQVEALVDSTGDYLVGQSDTFGVQVDLRENKREAAVVLEEIADRRLESIVATLPVCTAQESLDLAAEIAAGRFTQMPSCRPSFLTPETLKPLLALDLSGAISASVLANIPDTVEFNESLLRQAISTDGGNNEEDPLERLDQVRDWLKSGFTYTDGDLREDLGENGGRLDDVRAFLSDSWTYTHEEFREDLSERNGGESLDSLDTVRSALKRVRGLLWLAYLVLALLLVSIGFLGGRNWRSRVIWAAAPVAISGLILIIVFSAVYSGVVGGIMEDVRADTIAEINQTGDFYNTQVLATNKAFDVAEDVPAEFVGGIRTSGVWMLIIGIVVILGAAFWPQIRQRVSDMRGGGVQPPAASPPPPAKQ
jgi:hypothetical protein